jgi:hypothetical protein
MSSGDFKLIAAIPSLNLSHTFTLQEGRRYLLGSSAMEPEMLVFSLDRSFKRALDAQIFGSGRRHAGAHAEERDLC